jgi:putative transposase
MPRRARLRAADLPLHLIQRGNNRSACFAADNDYLVYLSHLEELADRFDCAVHAYVLMTNHVHLLLTPAAAEGSSLVMKHLGQRYVQYFNRKYGRSGSLWEGRFRSSIVQDRDYLLRCYRYIEMNPVRAGMVQHPSEYRWSSYCSNAQGVASTLVKPHCEYVALSERNYERRAAYRSLFETELEAAIVDQIRAAANGGFALGDESFKSTIAAALGRRVQPGASGRPKKSSASPQIEVCPGF